MFFFFRITVFCIFFHPCASAARAGSITSLSPDTPLIISTGFCILLSVGLLTLETKKARAYWRLQRLCFFTTWKIMFLHRPTVVSRSSHRGVHRCQWRPWERCTFTWRHSGQSNIEITTRYSLHRSLRGIYMPTACQRRVRKSFRNYQQAVVIRNCQRFSLWMLRHLRCMSGTILKYTYVRVCLNWSGRFHRMHEVKTCNWLASLLGPLLVSGSDTLSLCSDQ